MRKGSGLIFYGIIGLLTFLIDRISKKWALVHATDGIIINQFLSFDLVLNRGVTAGMLQSDNPLWFTVLSVIIAGIVIGLSVYTYYRWRDGFIVIGELLTISGAVSNLIDRYLFEGVIDFIHISFMGYSFPIFNCADMCIVLGVVIMFFLHMQDDPS